ncbi:MAG: ATP-binding cassette domain-containing protein, partial [Pseudomonadales bacterium]|nr:ATP-binding cassette domain-containing protein [Pseudomonadales bacterium]
NVGFGYDTNRQVLSDINLTVERGQTIALVGPTGGGKTTLVNVICRFYEPTRGGVYFDGVDYRNRSHHWLHSNLGIVLQQAHVFSGSVRDNIRYGKLDATDREVEDAAKLSEAHEFISGLERGYDTEVGEGGNRLSAGEKQLLSFARAILASPQILVLDEATSSVDSETEQRIQHGIERMLTGRISFIIAHRLTTIRNADRIVFIDDGHIVEMGSHEELLQSRGRYFELYAQQSMDQSFRAAWQHESLSAS